MTGVLALQLHAGPAMTVQFKDLQLKKLGTQPVPGGVQDLQGTWPVLAIENGGEAVPAEEAAAAKLIIKKNHYELSGREGTSRGTFSVDQSRKPWQMQIQPEGSADEGVLIKGIYELNNGVLQVCYGVPGGERPSDFSTTNSERTLIQCKPKQP